MAITWQNVAQPNLGSPVADMAAASEMMGQGFSQVGKVFDNYRAKQTSNARADLHASLMDIAMNANDEREYLKQALSLGKQSSLTPDQTLAEVATVGGTLNKMLEPTGAEKEEIAQMEQEHKILTESGLAAIEDRMKIFYSQNPGAKAYQVEMNEFEAGGGSYGDVLENVKFQDGDDAALSAEMVSNLKNEYGFSDLVVARAIKRVKPDDGNPFFDLSNYDYDALLNAMKDEKKTVDKMKMNYERGVAEERDMKNKYFDKILLSSQAIKDRKKQIKDDARAYYASK